MTASRRTHSAGGNPVPSGTTSVIVTVGGKQSETRWNVALSCPGVSLNPGDFPDSINVSFRFGSILTDARGQCSADVFIDGLFRLTDFVSPTTGTSQPVFAITKGVNRGIEYRNFKRAEGTQNILLDTTYVDRSRGTVKLQDGPIETDAPGRSRRTGDVDVNARERTPADAA